MITQKVYLAGPMAGLDIRECTVWRREAAEFLEELVDDRTGQHMYKVLDPCRGKDHLAGEKLGQVDKKKQGWGEEIMKRDRYDVGRCDVVLMNFTQSKEVEKASIGTLFELAWAHELNKFVIVVIDEDNINWHEFVRQSASIIRPTLNEALKYMRDDLNA